MNEELICGVGDMVYYAGGPEAGGAAELGMVVGIHPNDWKSTYYTIQWFGANKDREYDYFGRDVSRFRTSYIQLLKELYE